MAVRAPILNPPWPRANPGKCRLRRAVCQGARDRRGRFKTGLRGTEERNAFRSELLSGWLNAVRDNQISTTELNRKAIGQKYTFQNLRRFL